MSAGKLKHYVTIQQLSGTKGTAWNTTDTWEDLKAVWADIIPMRGKEFFQAEKVNTNVTHKIVVRYTSSITPKMRITWKGRIFKIIEVINKDEEMEYLEIMAYEVIT